jgi:hypothetical protein
MKYLLLIAITALGVTIGISKVDAGLQQTVETQQMIDYTCMNRCLQQGYMYNFCVKQCSY